MTLDLAPETDLQGEVRSHDETANRGQRCRNSAEPNSHRLTCNKWRHLPVNSGICTRSRYGDVSLNRLTSFSEPSSRPSCTNGVLSCVRYLANIGQFSRLSMAVSLASPALRELFSGSTPKARVVSTGLLPLFSPSRPPSLPPSTHSLS